MTSIVTNVSSQVALRTLQAIGTNLDKTQATLGTGKRIATARDNPAIWAVSKTVESEMRGFVAVQSSLDMGSATLSVARQGAESLVQTLGDMKKTIISARTPATDSAKLQSQFAAQIDQLEIIVASAQFNGVNLLKDTGLTGETGAFKVMAYAGGQYTDPLKISVDRHDLRLDAASVASGAVELGALANTISGTLQSATAISAGTTASLSIDDVAEGSAYAIRITGGTGVYASLNTTSDSQLAFTATKSSTVGDVRAVLATAFNAHLEANGLKTEGIRAGLGSTAGDFVVTAASSAATGSFTMQVVQFAETDSDGGGLGFLNGLDLTKVEDRDKALGRIDVAVDIAARAAADFGSAERQIEIQSRFSDDMAKTLKSRVGMLVDADMTALAARQQALQVQQSLAIQALSIANSSPQAILSLLR